MKSLVVIDACVRQSDSRTLRIAEPIIEALSERYKLTRYDLPEMDIVPLNPGLGQRSGNGHCQGRPHPHCSTFLGHEFSGCSEVLLRASFAL